jgi:hypothetical protein
MERNDITEFQRRLVAVAEMFNARLSLAVMALYFEALKDLPLEDVIRAMGQTVQSSKFMPKPAEIRSLILGDSDDVIERAWMALKQAMGQLGSYSSVTFRDPALGETVLSMFGTWPRACLSELSDEMWAAKRKEFGRVYKVFRGRNLSGVRYLPGISETDNLARNKSLKFVPLGQVTAAGEVKRLEAGEAERYRTQIAAEASGFTQVGVLMPAALAHVGSEEETA